MTRFITAAILTFAVFWAAPVAQAADAVKKPAAETADNIRAKTLKTAKPTAIPKSDIVATVAKDGDFKTLTSLLETAGLSDVLKSPGPYTIFAPTDTAFAKLAPSMLSALQKPQNKAKLRAVLAFHIVPGRFNATEFTGKDLNQNTIEGSPLGINGGSNGSITVGPAKVIGKEIAASNGTVFTIDSVMVPPSIPLNEM